MDKKSKPVVTGNIQDKKRRVNNRVRGANCERKYVKEFKEMGYTHCKTTRNASRLLDSCKIDLAQIPFNVQIKKGYKNNRPKADEIFLEMKELLIQNFPKEDSLHTYPKVMIHELDGYKEERVMVTMTWEDWKKMLIELNDLKSKNKQ